MPLGFTALIVAQFASGLADNALLIITIARLQELGAPAWWAPALKLGFTLAYVLLAPFVGAIADAWPKGRVMLATNGVKAAGAALLLGGADPLLAFTVVGIGAATYSPAKLGLLTELLPPQRLVVANVWLESTTVGAVLIGTLCGGLFVSPTALAALAWQPPLAAAAATQLWPGLLGVLALYGAAAVANLRIPASGARRVRAAPDPLALLRGFWSDNATLWRDRSGRVSLAVTTLFWGVGATLQFVVLRWAQAALGLGLDRAAVLQASAAVGLVLGAVAAGRWVSLARATRVLPLGVVMGLLMPCMTLLHGVAAAVALLVTVGLCAGLFVIPMNALLQHRGHCLLSAGRSIAVQNFNENLGVLGMLALYAGVTATDVPLTPLIWGFGAFVALVMAAIGSLQWRQGRHRAALLAAVADRRGAARERA